VYFHETKQTIIIIIINHLIISSNLDQIKAEAIALSYTNSSAAVIHAHPSLLSE